MCIFIRDKYTCVYCGSQADTIDHVKPVFVEWDDTAYNCVACCRSCNSMKQHRTLSWFLTHKFKDKQQIAEARRRLGLARRRRIDRILKIEKAKILLQPYIEQEVQKEIARLLESGVISMSTGF